MANKYVKFGSFLVNEYKGKKQYSIGLGNKSQDPKYDLNVELIVRDHTGKIVAQQTNGFINLQDPRTQPDELLSIGAITEEMAQKMKESVSKLSKKVQLQLVVPRS